MIEEKIKTGDVYINLYNTHDAVSCVLELFNPYLTRTENANQYIANGANWPGIPVTSIEQMQRTQAGLVDFDLGTIGWTFEGDVKMIDSANRAKFAGIVWGVGGIGYSLVKQGSYKALCEWLKAHSLRLDSCRMTVNAGSIPATFNSEWIQTRYNLFGQRTEINRITPIQYFKPGAIQPNIIDIPLNWEIDGFTGIEINVQQQVQMQLTFKTTIL